MNYKFKPLVIKCWYDTQLKVYFEDRQKCKWSDPIPCYFLRIQDGDDFIHFKLGEEGYHIEDPGGIR